jgi:hypothetical protein
MRIPFSLAAAAIVAMTLQAPAVNAASAPTPTPHTRQTMAQHFTSANTTHDGHLTLDQAKAGYPTVARHFDAIDKDKRGYVTENDIRAYYKTQRTLHHQAASTHDKPPNS